MALPTFRRKILSYMLLVVAVFGGLGLVMIVALAVSGSVPPALIHLNYDSIEAADHMKEAWTALRLPTEFARLPQPQAQKQFAAALAFAQGNVTEAGEKEVVTKISRQWSTYLSSPGGIREGDFIAMHHLLGQLVAINERGMFERVAAAKQLSRLMLAFAAVVLVITALAAVYLADTFATRLASPIKDLAEALHTRPSLDRTLKLPPPSNIELRILIREVRRLWDSLAANEKLNVTKIIHQKGQLETVLASVEDAFIVLDQVGKVSHCNLLMEQLLGLPHDQIIGCNWTDLPTSRAAYLELRERFAGSAEQESEIELAIEDKAYHFSLRSRRILARGSDLVGRLMLLRDITEKRQRDRLKAQLVDLLSHELKTPIQSLGMAAEMLHRRRAELPEDLQLFSETINEDVMRIRAVALQFTQASQSHARSMRIDLQRVDLGEVLRGWLLPFAMMAKDKGVEWTFTVRGQQMMWARIDPIKFPWAVANLLSNAIRFSKAGGAIEVSLGDEDGHTAIEVSDDGPGVPEAVQKRMFEPFFQGPVAPGDTTEHGLLGMGLTIAKEVVEAHGGHLSYRSRPPHGAVFRIELPTPAPMDG